MRLLLWIIYRRARKRCCPIRPTHPRSDRVDRGTNHHSLNRIDRTMPARPQHETHQRMADASTNTRAVDGSTGAGDCFVVKRVELPEEVTTQEAAEILGCCKHTVLHYLAEGLLEWRNAAPPSSQ